GADHFNTLEDFKQARTEKQPPLGIGKRCVIENAIIDKNARIGDDVRLSPKGKPDGFEIGDVFVRDGVLVVLK
ncbi:MAG TPA: glucose-1-phosphate adenylyltransferase, partial [Opitutales bacterium]|nr:glucose-1-phosphate adenylyltransferase [Opitutales bacterium]